MENKQPLRKERGGRNVQERTRGEEEEEEIKSKAKGVGEEEKLIERGLTLLY